MSQTSALFKPYESVGDISFGDDPSVVRKMLGEPSLSYETPKGEQRDEFNQFGIVYSSDGVVEIAPTLDKVSILVGKRLVSSVDDRSVILTYVESMSSKSVDIYGFKVFQNIGIALSDYENYKDTMLSMTMFARGRWDSIISQL